MDCPKCNTAVPDGAGWCPNCGEALNVQTYDPNWRKGLRRTGKFVTGMVFGIVLLAILFPINLLIALSGFSGSDSGIGIFGTVCTIGALAGGLALLLLNIKNLKETKRFNAALTESHKADIEAEKAAREQAKQQAQAEAQAKQQALAQQPVFNAGTTGKMLFELNGTVSTLQVYEDRVLHTAKTTARSFAAGKFFNGTKEYFYDDLINVQFRQATPYINGYLQFDYAGAVNISNSGFGGTGGNYSSENSFIFDVNVRNGASVLPGEEPIVAANRIVSDAYRYIHGRIMEEKKSKKAGYASAAPAPTSASAADELKKYNELLQAGAITQEEFDAKKKQLLNL